jgi:hypothetical protein
MTMWRLGMDTAKGNTCMSSSYVTSFIALFIRHSGRLVLKTSCAGMAGNIFSSTSCKRLAKEIGLRIRIGPGQCSVSQHNYEADVQSTRRGL